ncbi:MAG: hypothetical protein WAL20_04905, partial [Rhodomicrobium sp.]
SKPELVASYDLTGPPPRALPSSKNFIIPGMAHATAVDVSGKSGFAHGARLLHFLFSKIA